MSIRALTIICLFTCMMFSTTTYATRIANIASREELISYYGKKNIVIVASTGRSGSTMLMQQVEKYDMKHQVLKTHLLPPDERYKGKILFIFSNPDQAAESALYMTLHYKVFAKNHFTYMETVDHDWLERIGGPRNQTEADNLLSHDALGIYEHLKAWLYTRTEPSTLKEAQILAIKYEHLWEPRTLKAIKKFLGIPYFQLPSKRPRGHQEDKLFAKEIAFRNIYNLGTKADPRYEAYAEARMLWEEAPPFQYLKITSRPFPSE